jgi:NADH dehydrogenase
MGHGLVTVFGASGFLGRHILGRLADAGAKVRAASRHPERTGVPGTDAAGAAIEAVYADVRDDASVASALAGSEAVVNAVGLYVERGDESFEAIHVEGAARVARHASRAGAGRLVLISGIGADADSESPYVRARAHGESAVQEAFAGATVLRPGVLFGPGDAFFSSLARIAKLAPALPLFGNGDTRLQPVYVDDVAEAVAKVLAEPLSPGLVYELGGPETYTYRALLRLMLRQLKRRRLLLPVPFLVWELLAVVMSLLPNPPVTRDQITLMRRDNVVGPDALGFTDLGIEPASVEAVLPNYLG